ncbi:MAG: hypothetical protein WKF82_12740 [Nocardioidaceae bacterium]
MVKLDEELRARGYRLTPQRQLVLEAVATLGHATPEDVHFLDARSAPRPSTSRRSTGRSRSSSRLA